MPLWCRGQGRYDSRPGPLCVKGITLGSTGHGHSGLKGQECMGCPQQRLALGDSEQERGEQVSYPEPLYPCWALPGPGRTDRYM